MKQLDLFCNVVDNFGDAGVCWRLAKQMAHDGLFCVRLFIDKRDVLAKICHHVDVQKTVQVCDGVTICDWPTDTVTPSDIADVVIEGFGTKLPDAYVLAMTHRAKAPIWLNLEYLTAESWIDDLHQMASHQSQIPLVKYFFFPGFSEKSGGLIRETDLLVHRDAFQSNSDNISAFLARLQITPRPKGRLVSVFCYPDAPVLSLFEALSSQHESVTCLVPQGVASVQMQAWFKYAPKPYDSCTRGALTVTILPIIDQTDYDRLLWSCDFNFVRGEDSVVRAQWAAKPFAWHIYPQEENVHLDKLSAFLDIYTAGLSQTQTQAIRASFWGWNQKTVAPALIDAVLHATSAHTRQWSDHLAMHRDLAHTLSDFIKMKSENNAKCV